jgi:hypothetical protein
MPYPLPSRRSQDILRESQHAIDRWVKLVKTPATTLADAPRPKSSLKRRKIQFCLPREF